jgi:hypothetical protein
VDASNLLRSDGHTKVKGKWVSVPWPNVAEMDELKLFLLCFPMKYLKETVISQTNTHLTQALTMQELFVFIGCILFIACHQGIKERDDWWSIRPISAKEGPPFRLNDSMSRNHFKEIMQAI